MSLYGNFNAGHEKLDSIIQILREVGIKHSYIPLTIDGYEYKEKPDGKYVISFRIRKSQELESLRSELVYRLARHAPSENKWDQVGAPNWNHITIANNANRFEFEKIWKYLNSEENPYWHIYGMRVCLMEKKIIREYDLLTGRMLNRSEALDKHMWKETYRQFRKKAGMELGGPVWKPGIKKYLISDLHFDHENIIKYCGRPFRSVEEMNHVLESNWNYTVKPEDVVYYLGDLVFGRSNKGFNYWKSRLNGNNTFLTGNHETEPDKDWERLKVGEREFLLVHDPEKKPHDWNGWIIHGHKHNTNLRGYPFINGKKKTINVSAELVNYRPLDLDFLLGLDLDNIARMDNVDSKPVMKGEEEIPEKHVEEEAGGGAERSVSGWHVRGRRENSGIFAGILSFLGRILGGGRRRHTGRHRRRRVHFHKRGHRKR